MNSKIHCRFCSKSYIKEEEEEHILMNNREHIYKWKTLPKAKYYEVNDVDCVKSKFHKEKVLILLISGKWYWLPFSQFKRIRNLKAPFYIYADEKEDITYSLFRYWKVSYYHSLLAIIEEEFENIIHGYAIFVKAKNINGIQLGMFLKYISTIPKFSTLSHTDLFEVFTLKLKKS